MYINILHLYLSVLEKRGPQTCCFWGCWGWNTTQMYRDHFINHEIRIPIKQPVSIMESRSFFFSWLIYFFFWQMDYIILPLRITQNATVTAKQLMNQILFWKTCLFETPEIDGFHPFIDSRNGLPCAGLLPIGINKSARPHLFEALPFFFLNFFVRFSLHRGHPKKVV